MIVDEKSGTRQVLGKKRLFRTMYKRREQLVCEEEVLHYGQSLVQSCIGMKL